MEERKFIMLKKEEFGIKEYIKRNLGKGKISNLDIEYTPVGEKIIISTSKPGLVIGRKGEKIRELTEVLKRRFKLENPHIEIKEIEKPLFDSQLVADDIALALERMGNLRFKVIAYRKLQEIMKEGALGCELRLTGKLPSERSRSWRFSEGYLKKAGEPSKEIDRAQATALTKTGIIGIKVAIMPPDARIYDKIEIDDKMKNQIKMGGVEEEPVEEIKVKKKRKAKPKPKTEKKEEKETDNLKQEGESKSQKGEKSSSEELEDTKTEPKTKVLKETEFKPEEAKAMKIEEKIEEGIPEEFVEQEIKEDAQKSLISGAKESIDSSGIEKEKEIKEEKTEESKEEGI